MSFRGWPAEAFEFYAELEDNNNRTWWQEHRHVYDSAVKGPFAELKAIVEDEFGVMRMFRPHRDVRYAKDKSPYKTMASAMTESEGGSAYYVQISGEGLFAGTGMYQMASDQLERFRAALLDDRKGGEIERAVAELEAAGYEIGAAESLKTAPRGWPKVHPRTHLARRKGLVMGRMFPRAKWQSTTKALDRIIGVWHDAAPMVGWLDAKVGPSTLPPPEAR